VNNLTIDYFNTAVTLPTISVLGDLTVNAGKAISQGSLTTLSVIGKGTFTSSGSLALGNITLDKANSFGSVSLNSASGSAVQLNEADATQLDTVAVNAGTLTVTSGGNISQVSAKTISVQGAASFTAPGGDSIDVGNANSFNSTVNFIASGGGNL